MVQQGGLLGCVLLSALSSSDQKRECMRACSGGPETAHMPVTIVIRRAGAGTCGEARIVSPRAVPFLEAACQGTRH